MDGLGNDFDKEMGLSLDEGKTTAPQGAGDDGAQHSAEPDGLFPDWPDPENAGDGPQAAEADGEAAEDGLGSDGAEPETGDAPDAETAPAETGPGEEGEAEAEPRLDPSSEEDDGEAAAEGHAPRAEEPPPPPATQKPAASPDAPTMSFAARPSALSEHKARTLAAIASDNEEIAAFARHNGIDPSDPHPGAESLLLLKAILEASSRVGAAIASGGDALVARMDASSVLRKGIADETAAAAADARAAGAAMSEAAKETAIAGGHAASALMEAAGEMAAAIEGASKSAAGKMAPLVASHAGKAVGDAMDRGLAAFDEAAAAARDAAASGITALGEKAASRLLTHVTASIPKFEEAIARGVASSRAKKEAADPWIWRRTAIICAAALCAMAMSWGFGRELGHRKGYAAAEATAIQSQTSAPAVSRGRSPAPARP